VSFITLIDDCRIMNENCYKILYVFIDEDDVPLTSGSHSNSTQSAADDMDTPSPCAKDSHDETLVQKSPDIDG